MRLSFEPARLLSRGTPGPCPGPAWLPAAIAAWGIILGLGLSPLRASEAKGKEAKAVPPAAAAAQHWAFQPLAASRSFQRSGIDEFITGRLRQAGLKPGPGADRSALIRRVAFILTGLPPTPEEIEGFVSDSRSGAYERMIRHYLGSLRYGERWAKHWLDAAGYADSNGYFNADTDRPLAYRYRDYVIRSMNRDTPFDRFIREQLAGDEISGWKPGQAATPEIIELLEATHFLRNGQDGSGESDGNPDEVRTDRYYALESAMQIMGSSLLGLTVQCAKCHDHKFEPISQQDYYGFQAVLYPAFNIEKWVKPNDRIVHAHLPGELESWQALERKLDAEQAEAQRGFKAWSASNWVAGRTLFRDEFEGKSLTNHWSNTAPGDNAPAGSPAVAIDSETPPAAVARDGTLRVIEGGGSGDRWLCTKEAFDWRPAGTGQWIQVTFDLIATKLPGTSGSAERVAYLIAAHDFNDNSDTAGGNILIDGNPGGPTTVQTDYPGPDSKSRGSIGATGYKEGHNYGVRVTCAGTNEYILEHLVDGAVDGGSLNFKASLLPRGGFAFEYCCGRSFVVDNVVVEHSDDPSPGWVTANQEFRSALAGRKDALDKTVKAIAARRTPKPGRISWMTDLSADAPDVRLLKRGNHKTPGEAVAPSIPGFLAAIGHQATNLAPARTARSTGRRLALAEWLTEPNSPQAGLLARVTVNRIWQQYFGNGIVATPDNLGLSGAKPTHPELLDWLAAKFVESGWSMKAVHRLILESAVFRQSSAPRSRGLARDPENHLLWRYPLHRLDAESIRDAMLATGGKLGGKTNGPYVPTPRSGNGEIVVDEGKPEGLCRSIFLQQRRTQVPTFLGTFDAPSVVFNCTRRAATTMPLQSLSLLNSEFAVKRGADLARRVEKESTPAGRIRRAFLLTCGREPDAAEHKVALQFVTEQQKVYAGQKDAEERAWADFGQSLFGLNSFLYLE